MKCDILKKPLSHAYRALIADRLDEAGAACDRLRAGDDPAALHDFRVALRRLDSLARAYGPRLGDCMPKELRKRIRRLAAVTSTARDCEVQIEWLRQHDAGRPHEQTGILWLAGRLERRLADEYEDLRERIPADFARLGKRVGTRLRLDCGSGEASFGVIAADLTLASVDEFRRWLDRARQARDEDAVHRARIAAKRLRYLLEPLAKCVPEGKALVKELKTLQDLMGEIHDIQVFGAELTEAAEEAGAERQRRLIALSLRLPHDDPQLEAARRDDERAGLIGLARDLHERREDLLSRFFSRLDERENAELFPRLEAAAQALHEIAAT